MIRKALALFFALLLSAAFSACGLKSTAPQPPASTAISTPLPSPSASAALSAAPSPSPAPDPEVRTAIDYFREIAFVSEYGGGKKEEIRKWTQPMLVQVGGDPTAEDSAALARAMDGLNAVPGYPGISLAKGGDNPNVHMWFVKVSEMDRHVSGYVPGNWGFFSTTWDESGIREADIAIADDVTDQLARNHLIFEELLQSTGLMQDSDRYPDSIYYGEWTTVQQPAKIDWELLDILYLPDVKQGMTPDEAMKVIGQEYDGR